MQTKTDSPEEIASGQGKNKKGNKISRWDCSADDENDHAR